jgi:hypothetical protein
MKRVLVGLVILLHGLAHASIGVWAFAEGPVWLVTPLWGVAMLGYLVAALGILRVPLVRDVWKQAMVAATIASIPLLLVFGHAWGVFGVLIDVIIFAITLVWAQPWGAGILALVYAAVVVAIRPIYVRWGTTATERVTSLPGDQLNPDARYRIDHAITIHAPADSVWPWLAQLGQDRGGFYSYSWLERMVGDHVQNADRIHPEWQHLEAGDLVRAVQPDYLGGRFGDVGWRVIDVVPGRAVILDKWGAFVVQPVDAHTSRLIVRTREPGTPSLAGIVFGPFSVFVFEPAHFIMQRGMLRGVRDRAERQLRG